MPAFAPVQVEAPHVCTTLCGGGGQGELARTRMALRGPIILTASQATRSQAVYVACWGNLMLGLWATVGSPPAARAGPRLGPAAAKPTRVDSASSSWARPSANPPGCSASRQWPTSPSWPTAACPVFRRQQMVCCFPSNKACRAGGRARVYRQGSTATGKQVACAAPQVLKRMWVAWGREEMSAVAVAASLMLGIVVTHPDTAGSAAVVRQPTKATSFKGPGVCSCCSLLFLAVPCPCLSFFCLLRVP
ncbi:hypothetical protein DUNSADRAFT_5345 [Dunaliella salina]|uniref:Encoded protein n=1 Tax=Dunaliella salina TaxID=3046 RepID=A0ABQ7GQH3_DUNSA|nr:hypothetical protein DUNSADRAFT_5345 [Dunaliella salina]|eukprot:KAF5836854.1 hypothetical protein DUNSADRAFT_5345 [Dunaliella salina]